MLSLAKASAESKDRLYFAVATTSQGILPMPYMSLVTALMQRGRIRVAEILTFDFRAARENQLRSR